MESSSSLLLCTADRTECRGLTLTCLYPRLNHQVRENEMSIASLCAITDADRDLVAEPQLPSVGSPLEQAVRLPSASSFLRNFSNSHLREAVLTQRVGFM